MQHPVGDHALLADGRTAALVDPNGNVAWLCWPRIDSAPCLLSILDDLAGGVFTVAPADRSAEIVTREYLPGTLILRTVWRAPGGELTVDDALAWDAPQRLLRRLRARGSVEVLVRVALAPDAARAAAQPHIDGSTLSVRGGGLHIAVHAPATWTAAAGGTMECRFTVTGAECSVVLGDAGVSPPLPSLNPTLARFSATVPAASALQPNEIASRVLGETTARSLLRQSAAVILGLRQRGGGIVAAPTTSIPQWPGTGRTWDYRYSWLRDTALAGMALLGAGLIEDAAGLGDFLGAATTSLPPAVLLRVDGSAPPAERILGHLRGYRGAIPVRLGNAASDQLQLDVSGEVLDFAAALAARDALPDSLRGGAVRLADWTADHWMEPDHGIWEIRGRPRRYTHSRVMAWSGLMQATRLSEGGVIAGDRERWRDTAQAIRSSLVGGGGPLQLRDAGGGPDAALAQAVLVGLFDGDDPTIHATLDSIVTNLDRGGLIDRHGPGVDISADLCAPFLFPTFWVAQALQRSGRDGSRYFSAAAGSRGAVNLFGEVADPADQSPLGNYPHVQSHAAFMLAAMDSVRR